MTFKLSITTLVGTFTRNATKPYTHVVVRNSPRARDVYARRMATTFAGLSGVDARWVKDRGYVVTWHGSEKAARAAAAKPYGYDSKAEVLGVFAVEAPAFAAEAAFQEYFWNLNVADQGFPVDERTARWMFTQR